MGLAWALHRAYAEPEVPQRDHEGVSDSSRRLGRPEKDALCFKYVTPFTGYILSDFYVPSKPEDIDPTVPRTKSRLLTKENAKEVFLGAIVYVDVKAFGYFLNSLLLQMKHESSGFGNILLLPVIFSLLTGCLILK